MRIILIGNYPPDGQESMERFAQMLESGFRQAGLAAEIWRPKVFFGAWAKTTTSGLGKWLGYVDKLLLFPVVLRARLLRKASQGADTFFHICDHSNSPYLKHLPANRSGITCHDVLAIRGARGYDDAYCPATSMGKVMQSWILAHLSSAKRLACVSELSLQHLRELSPEAVARSNSWQVIYNAFNNHFYPMERAQAWPLLRKAGLPLDVPFILHVGSSHARKNRGLLLTMAAALGEQWRGNICFAGEPLEAGLLAKADALGLRSRVVSVVKPDHETLVALYSSCAAFIFPSFSEGFGWPVIEAQSCGAPVIASNLAPMPEISGGGALHADPKQPQAFADAFLSLQHVAFRDALIRQGTVNCNRFDLSLMIDRYLRMYEA